MTQFTTLRPFYPIDTTTQITTTNRYNVSAVLLSTPVTKDGKVTLPLHDDFAIYSTALSVTIAIGCSLLLLNILIFAGVYYQREKSRDHKRIKRTPSTDTQSDASNNGLKLSTNTSISQIGSLSSSKSMDEKQILSEPRLPPPQFADTPVMPKTFQNNQVMTLNRKPMPPKVPKDSTEGLTLPRNNSFQVNPQGKSLEA